MQGRRVSFHDFSAMTPHTPGLTVVFYLELPLIQEKSPHTFTSGDRGTLTNNTGIPHPYSPCVLLPFPFISLFPPFTFKNRINPMIFGTFPGKRKVKGGVNVWKPRLFLQAIEIRLKGGGKGGERRRQGWKVCLVTISKLQLT